MVHGQESPERVQGGWRFRLDDPVLTMVAVNFQTRLRFGSAEFVIESPFDLHAAGAMHHLDPDHRAELGPLLDIYPDSARDAVADSDGTLRLTFAAGATITVRPDPQYEAWSFLGPDNAQVICMPGGHIFVPR